jgi:hypothetical protein
MNKKLETETKIEPAVPKKPAKPNDIGALSIESHVKIFDPNTREIIVEKRA